MKIKQERNETKKIAIERIDLLLTRAEMIYSKEPDLAIRYGELARKIAMKARIQMPNRWRIKFCNNCKKFLYPGINTHVRIKSRDQSSIIYYCEICKIGKKKKNIPKS